jgi:arabinose-5-phosphate isomerase
MHNDMQTDDIIRQAVEVLQVEAEGIVHLIDRIDGTFSSMVQVILESPGRVILAGIGKSGIVARKIVATLNSTGTRALFLHPVEAMHGDLGMVSADDVFIALSNSGETDELNILVPSIRSIGCRVVAFTGNSQSTLAQNSDIVIDVGVPREACPMGLAPTASTTAMLAMGDALAVVLINEKHFNTSDFRKFHPGGALGQRLTCDVRDFMLTGENIPAVAEHTPMTTAVKEMDRHGLGVTFVTATDGRLAGIITDGDIRRCVARRDGIAGLFVEDVMTRNPRRIGPDAPAYDALNLMEAHQITVLPVTDAGDKVAGILHLHDILGKGEFKFNGKSD